MNSSGNDQGNSTEKESIDRSISWKWVAAAALPSATILLGSLGYGVALSAESQFGVPHTQLFSSGMELVELSVWAVFSILVAIGGSSQGLWLAIGKASAWVFGITLAAWLLIIFLDWWWGRASSERRAQQWQSVKETLTTRSWKEKSTIRKFLLGLFYALVASFGGSFAAFFMALMLAVIILFAVSFPMIGMSAGQKHIRDYVIAPDHCVPLLNKTERQNGVSDQTTGTAANCVEVTKDDKLLGRGRVVFATSRAIVIWSPQTGAAERVPTEGAIVRVIASLDDAPARPTTGDGTTAGPNHSTP